MLKPATPLTVALLISFVLLLLSTLSTPVIKSIPLATFEGVNFGVFGYCTPDKGCTGVRVGYTTNGIFDSSDDGDFELPAGARHSLSSLLVVHPIAAFLNLIALGLAAAAHLHSPSHSARYLLGLLILLLPTLLITLLAFLVDILLFVPHLQWGGWIVLGSVISIAVSGVFTCAMRRTLVSRKARKKRIAENAEMSGENFYTRQAAEAKLPPTSTFSTPAENKTAMVNGAPGADNLPSFATYDSSRRAEEDRQPLTSQAGPNSISPIASGDNGSDRYYGSPPSRSNSQPRPQYTGSRDQFGNPLPPRNGSVPPMPVRGNSRDRPPYREPGMPHPNGMPPPGMPPLRGGYGPRGRGGYPPGAGYPSRGGYGPPPRGPPPQGYNVRGGYPGRGRGGFAPGMAVGAVGGVMMAGNMRGGPPPPPPGYASRSNDYSPPDERENPISPSVYSQPEAYGAYGARSQSPGRQYGSRGQSPSGGVRALSPPPDMPPLPNNPPIEAPADEYIPARAAWHQAATLPARPAPPGQGGLAYGESERRPRVNSGGSDVYYEDVDPRFAPSEPLPPAHPRAEAMPRILTPGGRNYDDPAAPIPQQANVIGNNSYEDLPGARSPAESETSNFTSVSQRGVNPNWRPGYGPDNFNNLGPAQRPAARQQQMRRDVLLQGNPDFELPGMAPSRRGGRGGMRGGGMMRGPVPIPGTMSASAMGGSDGPYPRGPPPMGSDVRET